MANLLNRFIKQTPTAPSRGSYKYLDIVSKIDSTGVFKKIYDLDVIMNSWTNILMTPVGTYVFDPQYGSNLYKQIYEPADGRTVENIEREVKDKINKYDGRTKIDSINVVFFNDLKGFSVQLFFTDPIGNKQQLKLIMTENMYFDILRSS